MVCRQKRQAKSHSGNNLFFPGKICARLLNLNDNFSEKFHYLFKLKLIDEFKEWKDNENVTFVENESELQNAMKNLTLEKRLIGIYADRHLEYEYVRQQFVSSCVFVETCHSKFRRQKSRNCD